MAEETTQEKTYTLTLNFDNGTSTSTNFLVPYGPAGRGISKTEITSEGQLKIYYTDGSSETLGTVVGGDGSGGSITVDTELSSTSANPVQNKTITDKLAEIEAMVSYVEPTISTLTLSGTNVTSHEITSETGVTYNLTGFTHKETNKANIEGTLSFKKGSSTLISGIEPTDTATEITVTDNNTVKTAQKITYTLTGTSKKGKTISKSASIDFYHPSYIVVTTGGNVEDVDLSDTNPKRIKISSPSLVRTTAYTVPLKSDGYIWFVSTSLITNVLSQGVTSVPIDNKGTFTYNGGSYTFWRTSYELSGNITHSLTIKE